MKPMNWVPGLALLCLLAVGPAVFGETIPVDLGLTSPPNPMNHLEMTVTAGYGAIQRSDSDTTDASGNILSRLGIDFDPVTHQVQSVDEVEFTGGLVSFTDMSFVLDFSFFGWIEATGSGIGATLDTPYPPGTVAGGDFDTAEHLVVLNQGSFVASGTGLVGGVLDPNPTVIDLSTSPVEATTSATGQLQASLASIHDSLATYDVVLTLPVNFDEAVMDDGTVSVRVAATGTFEAAGQFTRALPPPVRIWDGLGEGDWGQTDGGGFSRWLDENHDHATDIPGAATDAVVQADTVLVAADREARSLNVISGGVEIASGRNLTVGNDVTFAAGTALTLGPASQLSVGGSGTFDAVVAADGSMIDGSADICRMVSFPAGPGTLHVEGLLRMLPGAEFACRVDAASADLITADDVLLRSGSKLTVQATEGLASVGEASRTVMQLTSGSTILGVFTDVPDAGDHLGHGVFFEDVTTSAASVTLGLFQAADGDANGDRRVNGVDIQAILSANKFGADVDTDWPEGDFTGDGRCNGLDIQAILATNLFGLGEYAAMEPGVLGDGTVDLVVDSEGITIDTNGLTINGYVLISAAGIFTGKPARNLGFFKEDTDTRISGNFSALINGQHLLGDVIGNEFSQVDLMKDLTFTYTIQGAAGVHEGNLIIPEPSTLAMLIGGMFGLWACRRRRGRQAAA
ncbi:MAG: PEP-CTERM sorting domain-containing protein [Pirellulales bacterium]|nr:PEP-CTERM sorting domain-containing protein [Pirellulales bacterium]